MSRPSGPTYLPNHANQIIAPAPPNTTPSRNMTAYNKTLNPRGLRVCRRCGWPYAAKRHSLAGMQLNFLAPRFQDLGSLDRRHFKKVVEHCPINILGELEQFPEHLFYVFELGDTIAQYHDIAFLFFSMHGNPT